jgi:GT2 family glycosyltransferase
MRKYSVVIVAHENHRELLGTLLALRHHTQPSEVLLVGASADSELDRLAALSRLPIRRLTLPAAGSLGAAYNVGLDHAACDSVLLLQRAVIESDPAGALDFLQEHGDVGVVGGKLLRPEPPPRRVWHAGYRVSRGRVGIEPIGRDEWDRYGEVREVEAVSGACMLVRRTEVRFDERYWFRLEDVDFCFQYRQHGYRVMFFPSMRAIRLVPLVRRQSFSNLTSDARRLAGHWLYHQRWASDAPLTDHTPQVAVRGDAARDFLLDVDARHRELGAAPGV